MVVVSHGLFRVIPAMPAASAVTVLLRSRAAVNISAVVIGRAACIEAFNYGWSVAKVESARPYGDVRQLRHASK